MCGVPPVLCSLEYGCKGVTDICMCGRIARLRRAPIGKRRKQNRGRNVCQSCQLPCGLFLHPQSHHSQVYEKWSSSNAVGPTGQHDEQLRTTHKKLTLPSTRPRETALPQTQVYFPFRYKFTRENAAVSHQVGIFQRNRARDLAGCLSLIHI